MTACGVSMPEQQDLFARDSSRTLTDVVSFLNDGSRFQVEVKATRNRVSMITIDFAADGAARVRMHEAFVTSPWDIIASLRRYLRTRRRKEWAVVESFAQSIETKNSDGHCVRVRTAGKVYDLKAIFAEVNRDFFNGRVKCRITWGRMGRPRRRRKTASICFGSWNSATGLIRIHPALDDERVPPEFVRYIVFHEALHALFSMKSGNKRRGEHSPEFRVLERSFPDLASMKRVSTRMLRMLSG